LARESAPMLMVNADPAVVELQVHNGEFLCPADGSRLAKWGWARARRVRGVEGVIKPRKLHCPVCKVTHVLLPETLLVRKNYGAELVGQMLQQAATGLGFRPIAAKLDIPASTVRRLLRTVRRNAGAIIALLAVLIRQFDPLAPAPNPPPIVGRPLGALVAAVSGLVAAVQIRFGPMVRAAPWVSLSQVTAGRFASEGFAG